MRLLLAGGGTGGHLFPAVAIAQHLLANDAGSEVLFVGTEQGIEADVLPRLQLPLKTIDIAGFVGKPWGAKLALLPKLFKSLRQSLAILDQFRPNVVLGVGGYASGPVLVAATQRGVPIVIHEQNAHPGLTNRLVGRWASSCCLSFPETERYFPSGSTHQTGNPVREEIRKCPPLPSGKPQLLVFGGSRGAHAINEAVLAALPHLSGLKGSMQIVHQTGRADEQLVREGYRDAGWEDVVVTPFIDDMATAYATSHLVVCRAGATTIAELTVCGRAALLIPFPHAAGDHQTANAVALAEKGAALHLDQSHLSGERLAELLAGLCNDRRRLEEMAGSARTFGRPDAAERVLDQCRAVVERKV